MDSFFSVSFPFSPFGMAMAALDNLDRTLPVRLSQALVPTACLLVHLGSGLLYVCTIQPVSFVGGNAPVQTETFVRTCWL